MNEEILQRLERLETHLTHVERHCEELNQVVIEQARTIRQLQTQQQRLANTVEAGELDRIKSTNARPPHYQ